MQHDEPGEYDMRHMDHIQRVADEDVRELQRKEETYRGSWKRRGGIGAYMMIARKIDRLENMMDDVLGDDVLGRYDHYDVFGAIQHDASGADGTALAEIRDLRRYLLLVEAEMIARGVVPPPTPSLDAGHEARVTRRGLELLTPGTPDDGGHHEERDRHAAKQLQNIFGDPGRARSEAERRARERRRVEDGVTLGDASDVWWPTVHIPGTQFLNANRAAMAVEDFEHLPRLFQEQNAKEWGDLPAEYQSMYNYHVSEVKYRLAPEYREHWGRQS